MNLEAALQTFIEECRDLLADMESGLLALGPSCDMAEHVNAIFRGAHTIKGSAGLFGLDHIVAFTHVVESVLDGAREGRVTIDEALKVLLLSCCDHLLMAIDAVASGELQADEESTRNAGALIDQLGRYHKPAAKAPAAAAVDKPSLPLVASGGAGDVAGGRRHHWHLSLRFGADVLRNGMDPLSFIRYLRRIGRIVGIAALDDALPEPAQMDPEACYLGFEIALASDADKAKIESVFEFVREDCELRILPPDSLVDDYVRLIQALPEGSMRLGEILIGCGSLTQRELDEALSMQARLAADDASSSERPKLGAVLVDQQFVQPALVEAALSKQTQLRQASDNRSQEGRSLRIDADKLDHLINLVGELIIAGASADLLARQTHRGELQEATSRMAGLVQQVRDSALQLRMVKIGATFSRFQRVVHDVARETAKDIALQISGEDAELDKTVVEKIGDPLMHLVRNAIDHGIEPAEARLALGKPAQGTVKLHAFHDSGSIVIEVTDDGGGLKRDRIVAKALERGLIEPEQRLSDDDVFALIFEPGFSTAETVTNLSGRGVGMDVVKRNITALRGTIAIRSAEGQGTTVSVRLPLTLAIIDGFLVGVGGSVFVVPLDAIEECIEHASEPGQSWCNLRGHVLPQIRLRDYFEIQAPPLRRESVVVIQQSGQRFGLVVDQLMGEFQTVIKPLSRLFANVKSISGSTILGSGEVALILDVSALVAGQLSTAARASPVS
ncbi:chemotaxis protein CheW [Ideonella sp.]|uniref:chemotaxis protein CheA n=1 Tax=Ideonella sp. TaxID=1929293 RepID=UPI0035AEA5F9